MQEIVSYSFPAHDDSAGLTEEASQKRITAAAPSAHHLSGSYVSPSSPSCLFRILVIEADSTDSVTVEDSQTMWNSFTIHILYSPVLTWYVLLHGSGALLWFVNSVT